MANKDRALDILRNNRAGAGICDDCLAELSGIQPRQTVNRICRELQSAGVIERRSGDCSKRNHNSGKLQNFLMLELELVPPQEFVEPNPRAKDQKSTLPALKDQTDILSQWLFDGGRFLDHIDPLHVNDPFAGRVTRLKADRAITPALARRMLTLNSFRVQVVKERKPLDGTEWDLARKYIDESFSDWRELAK
jgi:hypothetical protein